jgi:hypothetical protein
MINPTNKSVANARPEIALVLSLTIRQHPFEVLEPHETPWLKRHVRGKSKQSAWRCIAKVCHYFGNCLKIVKK